MSANQTAAMLAVGELRNKGIAEDAIACGLDIGEKLFSGRGYKGQRATERHLSEAQVIAIVAMAYYAGKQSC